MRRDVAPVGERVDVGAVLHPVALRQLEQRLQVRDVRVHAAVRDEPEQMHVRVARVGALEDAGERRVLEERAVLDRLVDPLEVLEEHAARADRQMADLGVAHLAGREPDRLAGRGQLRVRVLAPEPVEDGRLRELDRVPGPGRRDAPAVEDDERDERDGHRAATLAPAAQIAANDSSSSAAPPTSAPSTCGCASSSSAFSGLTEPP